MPAAGPVKLSDVPLHEAVKLYCDILKNGTGQIQLS
jgi:hypothetical protein